MSYVMIFQEQEGRIRKDIESDSPERQLRK
jgi:hypothetical protein